MIILQDSQFEAENHLYIVHWTLCRRYFPASNQHMENCLRLLSERPLKCKIKMNNLFFFFYPILVCKYIVRAFCRVWVWKTAHQTSKPALNVTFWWGVYKVESQNHPVYTSKTLAILCLPVLNFEPFVLAKTFRCKTCPLGKTYTKAAGKIILQLSLKALWCKKKHKKITICFYVFYFLYIMKTSKNAAFNCCAENRDYTVSIIKMVGQCA